MIDKTFYKKCIKIEVYGRLEEYRKRKLTFFDKIWARYFIPELNAVYLIRKLQYYSGFNSFFARFISRIVQNKLIRQYGVFVNPSCVIGLGLRVYHPTSIVITNAVIGDNFTIFQNCNIGQKYAGKEGYGMVPCIGNNCSMYANSSIIGNVKVTDGVIVGAHSCLLDDASESGVYIGTPAKLKKQ